MSEIRATTISDAAGTGPITLTKQSAAKAWVNFNGSGTVAVRDSQGVSGLVDNGSGRYAINYSSNMDNTSYCTQVTSSYGSTEAGGIDDDDHINGIGTLQRASGNTAVGQTKIIVGYDVAVSGQDHAQVMLTIHGDLA